MKKRTAKHLCVTYVAGLGRAVTCVFCRDRLLTPIFSGPLKKDLFKGK